MLLFISYQNHFGTPTTNDLYLTFEYEFVIIFTSFVMMPNKWKKYKYIKMIKIDTNSSNTEFGMPTRSITLFQAISNVMFSLKLCTLPVPWLIHNMYYFSMTRSSFYLLSNGSLKFTYFFSFQSDFFFTWKSIAFVFVFT